MDGISNEGGEAKGDGSDGSNGGRRDAALIRRAEEQRDRVKWMEEEEKREREKRMKTNMHSKAIGRMYEIGRMLRRAAQAPRTWARSQTWKVEKGDATAEELKEYGYNDEAKKREPHFIGCVLWKMGSAPLPPPPSPWPLKGGSAPPPAPPLAAQGG